MKKRTTLLAALLCVAFGSLGTAAVTASAAEPVLHPSHTEGYCLACDVAEQINALPAASDITLDNAAAVTQQIHNIDRIKFGLSDAEFSEMVDYLSVELTDTGFGVGEVTKYEEAIDAVESLVGGSWFAVQKKFDLGGEAVQDTSEAEVSFELKNVDTNAVTTLSLFDFEGGGSVFSQTYGLQTAEGWEFWYKVPAGTYEITEVGLENPITVNGTASKFVCTEMSCGEQTVAGNGITVSIADGETKSVSVMNMYNPHQAITLLDQNDVEITDSYEGLDSVSITISNSNGEEAAVWTGSAWNVELEYEEGQEIVLAFNPTGAFCKTDYEITTTSYPGQAEHTIKLHPEGELVAATAKTCTTDGMMEHVYCEHCDKYYSTSMEEVAREDLVTELAGHTYGELVPELPKTCIANGLAAHYQCSVCLAYFNAEKEEVEPEELILETMGHAYGSLVPQVDATCTQTGMYSHYHCSQCDKYFNYLKQEKTLAELTIPVNAHEFGEWVETQEAGQYTNGELSRTCTKCGHVETQTIDPTGAVDPGTVAIGAVVAVFAVLLLTGVFTSFMNVGGKQL
ncbi:MAG: hypothetical protein IJV80_06195 [Clostridia bacterium]|nr:hypothetical protein [Clostridia bacterium]